LRRFPAPFVDALAEHIRRAAEGRRTTIVAIDGWGCGGKSTLAVQLRRRLGPSAVWTGTDDFFAGFDPVGWDEARPVRHLRWAEMVDALESFRATGRATVRRWNWEAARPRRGRRVEARVVLFDGLYSLKRELARFVDVGIWVEGRADNRMERVARRDGAHAPALWETGFTALERAYILAERPFERADVVVAGADLAIGGLGAQLRRL
jgi:uridine kinase